MSGEFLEVMARTLQAQQDMSKHLYHIVRQSADGQCQIASNAILAPKELVGVLQNKPSSLQNATVGFFGVSKLVCGSACTQGRLVTTQQSGQAANASSGDFAIGMALNTGVQGETISALLFQPALQLTTQSFAA